jgi:hypothetical protein
MPELGELLTQRTPDGAPQAPRRPIPGFAPIDSHHLFEKIRNAGPPLGESVPGGIWRGVKTGGSAGFVIDRSTRARLLAAHAEADQFFKPLVSGQDLRPWYQEESSRWLIYTGGGVDLERYPSITEHLRLFRNAGAGNSQPNLDAVDPAPLLEGSKLLWPESAALPRYSWDEEGRYIGSTGCVMLTDEPAYLALLQSRVLWFAVTQTCASVRPRAGLWEYRLLPQSTRRLPVPPMQKSDRGRLAELARGITEIARTRYKLHRESGQRILRELAPLGGRLNQALNTWWELDYPVFRGLVRKAWKREILPRERRGWEEWLTNRQEEHYRLSERLVGLEEELNQRVYRLFDLNLEEIRVVEETTQYRCGEV